MLNCSDYSRTQGRGNLFYSASNSTGPDSAGELGTPCDSKPICGGDGLERSTKLLPGPVESVKFCPFGSEDHVCKLKGACVCDSPGESARTGREQRYPGLLMLKGCGTEKKRGDPDRTFGPIQACPAFIYSRQKSTQGFIWKSTRLYRIL